MSMHAAELAELVRRMREAGLASATLDRASLRLVISDRGPDRVETAPGPLRYGTELLRSPGVGRLWLRHPAQDGDLLMPGGGVAKGDTVAFVVAGMLVLPVVAGIDARSLRFLVEHGTQVDYDRPLAELIRVA